MIEDARREGRYFTLSPGKEPGVWKADKALCDECGSKTWRGPDISRGDVSHRVHCSSFGF